MKNIFDRLQKELDSKKPLARSTIIETIGSSPQIPGASVIFSNDGLIDGTLGGGILEARAEAEAIAAQLVLIRNQIQNKRRTDL
jgi:xanthine dehydrogenase accessory factor